MVQQADQGHDPEHHRQHRPQRHSLPHERHLLQRHMDKDLRQDHDQAGALPGLHAQHTEGADDAPERQVLLHHNTRLRSRGPALRQRSLLHDRAAPPQRPQH